MGNFRGDIQVYASAKEGLMNVRQVDTKTIQKGLNLFLVIPSLAIGNKNEGSVSGTILRTKTGIDGIMNKVDDDDSYDKKKISSIDRKENHT